MLVRTPKACVSPVMQTVILGTLFVFQGSVGSPGLPGLPGPPGLPGMKGDRVRFPAIQTVPYLEGCFLLRWEAKLHFEATENFFLNCFIEIYEERYFKALRVEIQKQKIYYWIIHQEEKSKHFSFNHVSCFILNLYFHVPSLQCLWSEDAPNYQRF